MSAKPPDRRPPVGGYKPFRRKRSWGKPIALTLFVLLVAGRGVLHVMPINTAGLREGGERTRLGLPGAHRRRACPR